MRRTAGLVSNSQLAGMSLGVCLQAVVIGDAILIVAAHEEAAVILISSNADHVEVLVAKGGQAGSLVDQQSGMVDQ